MTPTTAALVGRQRGQVQAHGSQGIFTKRARRCRRADQGHLLRHYRAQHDPPTVAVYEPDLLVVDLTMFGSDPEAWEPIQDVLATGARVLAFGPHMDVEAFRAAKDAGVTRVVSNSQFHRNMANLIERYALPPEEGQKVPEAVSEDEG
jgi:hypothetical protein